MSFRSPADGAFAAPLTADGNPSPAQDAYGIFSSNSPPRTATTPAATPRPPRRRAARRAAHPCDACRRRKSRCLTHGDSAVCTMCDLRGSACTFLQQPVDRRGGGGGRAKASAPARAAARTPAAATTTSSLLDVSASSPSRRHAENDTRRQLNRSAPEPETEHNRRQDGRHDGSGHERPNPAAEEHTLGSEPHRFAELYGLTSDSEPLLMRHRPFDAASQEYSLDTHSIRRVHTTDSAMEYPVVFHMVADAKATGYVDGHAEADRIEALVAPFGPRLVRLYWLLVQPSFPLLCPARFMRQYAGPSSYRAIHAPLLGAVYLQALTWWTYDSELSLRPLPDVGQLRRLTLDAIQTAFHRPRLASIQAMLVYLHCRPEAPLTADHTFARGLTSQMLAVAEAMGLHADAGGWTIPAWERAERRRLAWALYMQDKWTALAYGRPSHIADDNWGVQDLVDADLDEEEGVEVGSVDEMMRRGAQRGHHDRNTDAERRRPTHAEPSTTTTSTTVSATSPAEGDVSVPSAAAPSGRVHFLLMVALTKILSRVLQAFFTLRTSRDQDTARLLEAARPFLGELAAWRARLAAALPVTPQRPRHLCPVGSIHFCYYGVVINLFRRLVRSTALAPLCSDPAVLSSIRQQAIQAAHEATHFVTSLRLDQLEAFWYFPSPYMFALVGSFHTLLLVTALSTTERDYWRETLSGFLWSLRIMSKASDPMRYAANRLEGGVLRGLEHALVVNVDHPPSSLTAGGVGGGGVGGGGLSIYQQMGGQDALFSRGEHGQANGALHPAVDLEQLLQQLDSAAQFAYTDYSDFGLQSFDWLSMQVQNQG